MSATRRLSILMALAILAASPAAAPAATIPVAGKSCVQIGKKLTIKKKKHQTFDTTFTFLIMVFSIFIGLNNNPNALYTFFW